MAKSFNGAGLFSMPWGVSQAGLLAGMVSLAFFAYIAYYTMGLLVKMRRYIQCQEEYEQRSKYWTRRRLRRWEKRANAQRLAPDWQKVDADLFNDDLEDPQKDDEEDVDPPQLTNLYDRDYIFSMVDIGWEAMGYWGEFAVYFNTIVGNIGVCTIFYVLSSNMLHQLVPELPIRLWMVILFPILLLLSWIRTPRYLSSFSTIGLLFLAGGLLSVVMYGFMYRWEYIHLPWEYGAASWIKPATYPLFFGVASFLFNTHPLVLPTEQAMVKRTNYQWALRMSFIMGFGSNFVFATLAFMFWGEDVEDNVIENLPRSIFLLIVQGSLVFELVMTYSLCLMPVVRDIDSQILYPIKKKTKLGFYGLSTLVRTICVILTLAFALIFAQKFGYVVAFIGGICPNLIGWTFPALFHLCLMRHRMNIVEFLWNEFIVIFGVFTMIACTTVTILGFVN